MRQLSIFVLTILVISGSNASFLDSLSGAFSGIGDTLHSVFDPVLSTASSAGSSIGSSLLSQAQTAGSLLLSTTAQTLLHALQSTATPPPPALVTDQTTTTAAPPLIPVGNKRDVEMRANAMIMEFMKRVKDFLEQDSKHLNVQLQKYINDVSSVVHKYARGESTKQEVVGYISHMVETFKSALDDYSQHLPSKVFKSLTHDVIAQETAELSRLFSLASHQISGFFKPHVNKMKQMADTTGKALVHTVTEVQHKVNDVLNTVSGDGPHDLTHVFSGIAESVLADFEPKLKALL